MRDLLHIGTGMWTLGLPYWNHAYIPITVVSLALAGILMVPVLAMGALSIGDGLGGFIGGEFGKAGYRIPWAKRKTYLGSVAVALGALAASLVEAVSPRSSDNLLVPAVVFLALLPVTM